MKLGVLCQSPVSEGSDPARSVHNTVELAMRAEKWGYQRFWLAEHHSDPALASASPEILATHIAARTTRMKVGTGGVLLPYYKPFKVAEQFRMLAALHPGRIELGLGRAGGSEGQAPAALGLQPSDPWRAVLELLAWLEERAPLPNTFASPRGTLAPTPWILGTSANSATFAGTHGLPYAFGGFLDPRGLQGALMAYHQAFRPSRWAERPTVNLSWYVQAADTEAEAWEQARSSEHWFVRSFLRGDSRPFPDPAGLTEAGWSPMEQMAVQMRRQFAIVGSHGQVVQRLRALQQQTLATELTLVTIPFDHADRMRSYEGLATEAGLF